MENSICISFGAQYWVAAMHRFVLIKSHWNLKVCFSLNNTLVSIHCSFLSVRLTQLCSHQLWFVDPLFNLVYSILCFLLIPYYTFNASVINSIFGCFLNNRYSLYQIPYNIQMYYNIMTCTKIYNSIKIFPTNFLW